MSEQDTAAPIIIPAFKVPTARLARACAACHYAVKEQGDLTCHRMPPQLTYIGLPQQVPAGFGRPSGPGIAIQNFSGWPIVRQDQWCGEFRPKGGDS